MLEGSPFLPRAMGSTEPVIEAERDSGWEASECSAREEAGKRADAVPAEAVGRVA